jgi:hypothetical protein
MSRKIEISLENIDISLTAELLDEVNRDACDILWKNIPYESVLLHTMVSGKNVHTFIPEPLPFYEHQLTLARRMATAPGTVFSPFPRCLFIKYGPDSEDHSFPPVARLVESDLPQLDRLGKMAWDSMYKTKEIHRLRVTRVGDETPSKTFKARLYEPASFESQQVGHLVGEINAEIEKFWFAPPAELVNLTSGRQSTRTGMGSYGQYFSTLFYAEGEVNRLSNIPNIGCIDNLLRLCRQSEIDLPTLKTATKTLCTGSIQYLKMCGQGTISTFFNQAVEAFPSLTSKNEYFRLFSTFALYTSRLHAWHTHLFPWHLAGDQLPYTFEGQAQIQARAS